MTEPALPSETDLSREEAWVVHAVLLAAIEAAEEDGEDASREIAILHAVEDGRDLDDDARERVRQVVLEYLADAPLRDRSVARNLVVELA